MDNHGADTCVPGFARTKAPHVLSSMISYYYSLQMELLASSQPCNAYRCSKVDARHDFLAGSLYLMLTGRNNTILMLGPSILFLSWSCC